jgi:hypothetical protein
LTVSIFWQTYADDVEGCSCSRSKNIFFCQNWKWSVGFKRGSN